MGAPVINLEEHHTRNLFICKAPCENISLIAQKPAARIGKENPLLKKGVILFTELRAFAPL
jgi:hypothetical protein